MNADTHLYSPITPSRYAYLRVNGSHIIELPEVIGSVYAIIIMATDSPVRQIRFFDQLDDAVATAKLIDLGYAPEGWITITQTINDSNLGEIIRDAWAIYTNA